MVEKIIPTQETITVNDKDYNVKFYAKVIRESGKAIVCGVVNIGIVKLYMDEEALTHKDDTEEQLRTRLIELLATS